MSHPHDDDTAAHDHEPLPVGDLLDKLGVKVCIHPGDFVSDAVVIFKVLAADGKIKVGMATSEDIQTYDVDAMLRKAADHIRFGSSA